MASGVGGAGLDGRTTVIDDRIGGALMCFDRTEDATDEEDVLAHELDEA